MSSYVQSRALASSPSGIARGMLPFLFRITRREAGTIADGQGMEADGVVH